MILPQLEEDRHGVDVLGIFFFNANTYMLKKGDPKGERLATIAKEKGMLLMMCDQCAIQRELAIGEAGGPEQLMGYLLGVSLIYIPY